MINVLPNFREEQSAKIPALTLLTHLGYQFIPPADCSAQRGSRSTVILPQVLRDLLTKKTFTFMGKEHPLSSAAIDKIVHELATPAMNEGLKAANEKLYNALTYGIGITEFVGGKKASPTIQIIDWENPENNVYHFTEELEVENSQGTGKRIPDLVCFVNGLPWVVIEAKRPDSSTEGKPTVTEGISQNIRNQKIDEIPHLFAYSQLLLSVNGHEGLYATCGTPEKFWAKWKEEEITEAEFFKLKNKVLSKVQLESIFAHRPQTVREEYESLVAGGDRVVTDQDRLMVSLLRHDRLLDMTRLFTLFDKKAGKIVARYQQVFGIKALVERITSFDGSPKRQDARNGGVIWHTTGSGKSFTMVFLSKALIWLKELAKCRVVVVTDRVDLEDQLARTFASGGALSGKDKKQAMATTGRRLAEQIGKGNERIIFSIINKFRTAINLPECYNDSPDMIVLVDEGHRSQNGENNIRMQQALPNAAFIAFTGTPLLQDDKTENKFGKIIHSYTMQQAVEDNTVTPLLYEERIPELSTNDKAIDAWFDRITDQLSEKQRSDLKKKFAQKGQIYQTVGRLELIAHDISDHFQNFKQQGLKGQLACDSKAAAIQYKKMLDDIGKVTSVVAMSSPDTREGHDAVDKESTDLVQNWWKENVGNQDEKAYTKQIIAEFGEDDGPDLMIVVDKLLTGFDEPKNTVLYIDKPLKQHNLIQAIARVNRLHSKKQFGYLIDYRGILKELDTTIEKYQELAERTQGGYDIDDLKGLYNSMETEYKKLPGLYAELWAIFDSVKNKQDGQALRQVLAPKIDTVNGQLTDTNLKKRDDFYDALTAFTNCLKVALQSATYFEDKSFDDKRQLYKDTLKMMSQLRKQVREDAEETIDYDEYTDDIRTLLDKHIGGVEVKESEGVYRVGNMGKDAKPKQMTDDEARNRKDQITGRISRMIEQNLADDPYAQEYFSRLLKKAIEKTKEMFDAPVKQYMLFADFEQQVKERKVEGIPSDRFAELNQKIRQPVQAYYGLFLKHLGEPLPAEGQGAPNEAQCFDYAVQIDQVVRNAVAEFSINPQEIENQITVGLLPLLFNDLGIDKAQALITDVVKITRLGLAGLNQ